jgi:hypothetical protein
MCHINNLISYTLYRTESHKIYFLLPRDHERTVRGAVRDKDSNATTAASNTGTASGDSRVLMWPALIILVGGCRSGRCCLAASLTGCLGYSPPVTRLIAIWIWLVGCVDAAPCAVLSF